MTIATTTTVGELAARVPHAALVFERFGIDYCCGGGKSLAEACKSIGVDVHQVLYAIAQDSLSGDSKPAKDYSSLSQRELIDHIRSTHHVFTCYELARLSRLIRKVVSVHGARHRELLSFQEIFRNLYDDLTSHMLKEENILFPYIVALEAATERGSRRDGPRFGTMQDPIHMMRREHDIAGDFLRALRSVTSNYKVPADACASYRTLYAGLEDFEADLHEHIHLENNILFPRAIEMEAH